MRGLLQAPERFKANIVFANVGPINVGPNIDFNIESIDTFQFWRQFSTTSVYPILIDAQDEKVRNNILNYSFQKLAQDNLDFWNNPNDEIWNDI